ncbi:hypothetical protein QUF80_24315 [Desulfococcaceae bacterium HSG8]|nr:hypothetical protein [Desulfococcaceae bacterium HSG8]
MVSCPWSVVSWQLAVGSWQLAVGSRQLSVASCPLSVVIVSFPGYRNASKIRQCFGIRESCEM